MAPYSEAELERYCLLNERVLRATSGNASKRLGTRREMRVIQANNAATTIQQKATQKRQLEKSRMQE